MKNALAEVKAVLRVSHAHLDKLYEASIEECLADMKVKGVLAPALNDPNILATVKLYCQAIHGDPAYSDAFMSRYEKKRDGLALAEGYGWKADTNE